MEMLSRPEGLFASLHNHKEDLWPKFLWTHMSICCYAAGQENSSVTQKHSTAVEAKFKDVSSQRLRWNSTLPKQWAELPRGRAGVRQRPSRVHADDSGSSSSLGRGQLVTSLQISCGCWDCQRSRQKYRPAVWFFPLNKRNLQQTWAAIRNNSFHVHDRSTQDLCLDLRMTTLGKNAGIISHWFSGTSNIDTICASYPWQQSWQWSCIKFGETQFSWESNSSSRPLL